MAGQRGMTLSLALSGLIGLVTREACAGSITMMISVPGHTIVVEGTLVMSQSPNDFIVNTTALNQVLIGDGSALQFSSLEAQHELPRWPRQYGRDAGGGSISERSRPDPGGGSGQYKRDDHGFRGRLHDPSYIEWVRGNNKLHHGDVREYGRGRQATAYQRLQQLGLIVRNSIFNWSGAQ